MSRYQQAPYSDNAGGYADNNTGYNQSYGNGGSGNGYGGYSDEPQEGGYAKYGGAASGGDSYPMGAANPYASNSSSPRGGYNAPQKKSRKWLWIGLGVLALIIVGAVLGGVLGTQLNKGDSNGKSGSSKAGDNNANQNTLIPTGVSSVNTDTATGANGERYLAIATNSDYTLPVYAQGTATAGYSAPTVLASPAAAGKWPTDPESPSNTTMRSHPRLGAPAYKWEALQSDLIANNVYLKFWNESIMTTAANTIGEDPEAYIIDGGLDGSGVLDVARRIKVRVKNWSYAYRMTNETKYADRVWLELQTAAGNNSAVPFGANGTRWNAVHFLDLAEFSASFAIAYDWLFDYWTPEQKQDIMWTILNLGLSFGQLALGDNPPSYAWWAAPNNEQKINGNWNCVCNGGLTMAALAIIDEDPTGISQDILSKTTPNAYVNCFEAAWADGTWSETSDYWYFGTTGAAEMVSSLMTATGTDRGLSMSNPGWANTSYYHIYVYGMTQRFDHGDSGPEKFSSTANSLFLWSTIFDEPTYALYQRDRYDAPTDPWSMFWYDPATSGTWWDGLALDRDFPSAEGNWATARSTWSDNNGAYWAMKSGILTGHQTHNDLDLGDFVIDAIGQRWFGEYGSGQYLSPGYFSSDAQDSPRWLNYRKATEGQNTIMVNGQNQWVNATPSAQIFGSSGTKQGPAPSINITTDDTAFYTCDISTGYDQTTVKRGIRFLNGRKQFLIQDDIVAPSGADVQWRVQTNATVTVNSATATLALGGQTLLATIIGGPSGAAFSTASPSPTPGAPAPPAPTGQELPGNVPNPGVTVLVVDTPNGGNFSLQVLINPQWSGTAESDFVTPPSVPIDNWTLTSHN